MHKNIAAGRNSEPPCRHPITLIRIRNVNRLVKLAMRVPRIQNVLAFGRLVIPLPRLRPNRISTECHPVRLHDFAAAKELQRAFFLEHNNAI